MNEHVLTITGIRSFLAYILTLTHLKIEKEFFNRGTRKLKLGDKTAKKKFMSGVSPVYHKKC